MKASRFEQVVQVLKFVEKLKMHEISFHPELGEHVPDGRPCRQTEHHFNVGVSVRLVRVNVRVR